MIRCSVNNDKEGIIRLWHEAFGDSRKEIEFFLENKYIPENTVVCEENGEIISLLFLLEGSFCIKGKDYPSYYLYAACTFKEFRGKGIMGKMLDFSKALATKRELYYICLMPAEESLFNYYSRFGYIPVFKRKIVKIGIDELNSMCIPDEISSDFSFKSAERLRNEAYENIDFFKWDRQSVEFAFSQTKLYGGDVFLNNKGYCLYTVRDSIITIKENTFTTYNLVHALKSIYLAHKFNEIQIILPNITNFFDFKYATVCNGMALPLQPDSELILKNADNPYLGLTLD